jgi:hypothetical protein
VDDAAVERVGPGRAGRATGGIGRTEHEVIDKELRAAVEELRQGLRALVRLERVLLLDGDPGQLSPLPCKLVAAAGQLLLSFQ